MRLFLSNIIHPTLWILIDTLAEFRSENDGLIKTDKQKAKILKLLNRQKPTLHKYQASPIIVHNLSNKALDQATERALAKGFNFAITPSQIPIENIICEIEKAITHLEPNTAETLRQETSAILRKAKPPKKNIGKEEI